MWSCRWGQCCMDIYLDDFAPIAAEQHSTQAQSIKVSLQAGMEAAGFILQAKKDYSSLPNRGFRGRKAERLPGGSIVATAHMFRRLSRLTPNGSLQCRCRPSCYWETTWSGRSSHAGSGEPGATNDAGWQTGAWETIQPTNNHQRAGYRPKRNTTPVSGPGTQQPGGPYSRAAKAAGRSL
jgi:hypothetical protein